jgi:hypothetical protein
MASKTSRLYQIEQVVTRALNEARAEESDYKRFLQFAFDSIRELYRGVLKGEVNQVKVVPDSLNRIRFPQDMEEFIAIGVPHGGKLYLLTERNDIIATYTEDDEGNLSLDSSDGEGVSLPTAQYESIKSIGGVNVSGYFKIDWANDDIIVNSTSRSELVLVYSTSGIVTDQIQHIPTKAAEAVVAYVLWKHYRGIARSTSDHAAAREWERHYKTEKHKLKIREGFSIQEFRDVYNRSNSLLRR